MEDVGRRQALKNLLVYLIMCGCCCSQLFAATQGTLGRTSISSAQITVHIPQSVRLLAQPADSSVSVSNSKFCLSVIDATARKGRNFYRVQSMQGLQADRYYRSEILRLNNLYGVHQQEISDCEDSTVSITASNWQHSEANQFVLMLIPE